MSYEALLDSLEPEKNGIDAGAWEAEWTEELRRRLAEDSQRFDLGQTLAELRAGIDRGR